MGTRGRILLMSVLLLPALPLDGGRIVLSLSCALLGSQRGAKLTEALSLFVGAALLGLGMLLLFRGLGAAVLVSAIWLLLYQESGSVLAKRPEMI